MVGTPFLRDFLSSVLLFSILKECKWKERYFGKNIFIMFRKPSLVIALSEVTYLVESFYS